MARALPLAVLWLTPKEGADVRHGHVGLRRPIRKEVDLAQYVDDAAGPGARLSRDNRARSLSAQRSRHALRQRAVFVAQVITTECVCKGRNCLVGRLMPLGTDFEDAILAMSQVSRSG